MTPMLCTTGDPAILKRKLIFEPKLDGIRAICTVNNGKTKLESRNQRNITPRYPELNFRKQKNCVIDGEIVAFDVKGNPNFNLVLKREQTNNPRDIKKLKDKIPVHYIVFDIIKLAGKDLTDLPLTERKKILQKTVKEDEQIKIMPFSHDGKKMWKQVKKRNIEGIIAKVPDSKYAQGRSKDWIKIKATKTIDCVIVGFTKHKRSISSIALAVYKENKLFYLGKAGTGLSEETIQKLNTSLSNETAKPKIINSAAATKVTWTKPKIVCEIKYQELTNDKILRAARFLRIRKDKKTKEATYENQLE